MLSEAEELADVPFPMIDIPKIYTPCTIIIVLNQWQKRLFDTLIIIVNIIL